MGLQRASHPELVHGADSGTWAKNAGLPETPHSWRQRGDAWRIVEGCLKCNG